MTERMDDTRAKELLAFWEFGLSGEELQNIIDDWQRARSEEARLRDEVAFLRASLAHANGEESDYWRAVLESEQEAKAEVARLREENAALRQQLSAAHSMSDGFRGQRDDARADLAKAQQQVRLIASDSDARAATWAEALAAVRADGVELRTALRRLEWSGPIRNGATTCPACRHDRGNGHGESCWLVGLLVAP